MESIDFILKSYFWSMRTIWPCLAKALQQNWHTTKSFQNLHGLLNWIQSMFLTKAGLTAAWEWWETLYQSLSHIEVLSRQSRKLFSSQGFKKHFHQVGSSQLIVVRCRYTVSPFPTSFFPFFALKRTSRSGIQTEFITSKSSEKKQTIRIIEFKRGLNKL